MTPYKCAVCGRAINKNNESYRGRMTAGMVGAIRAKAPKFHPKEDLCKPCGEEFEKATPGETRPAWMSRPLG